MAMYKPDHHVRRVSFSGVLLGAMMLGALLAAPVPLRAQDLGNGQCDAICQPHEAVADAVHADLDYAETGDSDGDGLYDGQELNVYLTDPWKPDTDGDGYNDWEELYVRHTDPRVRDYEPLGPDESGGAAPGPTEPFPDREICDIAPAFCEPIMKTDQ